MTRFYERRHHKGAWRILFIPLSTLWHRLQWCVGLGNHDRGEL